MFTENLSTFYSLNEHAEICVYTPQGGGAPVNVAGIFEAEYFAPLELVQTETVTFHYPLALTPSVKDGDTFVRSATGLTYLARRCERDWGGGVGIVRVHLEQQ